MCRAQQQIRKFKPKMVAIKDDGKVKQLQELIKDVDQQPEILVGDEGAVEVSQSLTTGLTTRFDCVFWREDPAGVQTSPERVKGAVVSVTRDQGGGRGCGQVQGMRCRRRAKRGSPQHCALLPVNWFPWCLSGKEGTCCRST